jgi:hypothetical protein
MNLWWPLGSTQGLHSARASILAHFANLAEDLAAQLSTSGAGIIGDADLTLMMSFTKNSPSTPSTRTPPTLPRPWTNSTRWRRTAPCCTDQRAVRAECPGARLLAARDFRALVDQFLGKSERG